MKTRLIALAAFFISAFTSAQVLAHHSFAAEFDSNQVLTQRGTVLKVEWTNPHTYIFIEVQNENGEYEEWGWEMGSPNGLIRRGWTRDTLQVGDEIFVTGAMSRDGSQKGNARTVVLADTCQRLFAGTSQRDFSEEDADPVEECDPSQFEQQ